MCQSRVRQGRTLSHPAGWTQSSIHSRALVTQTLYVLPALVSQSAGRAGPLPICRAVSPFLGEYLPKELRLVVPAPCGEAGQVCVGGLHSYTVFIYLFFFCGLGMG